MKIVHLTTSVEGGAGRAVTRINKALTEKGIDSEVLTWINSQENSNALKVNGKLHFLNKLCIMNNKKIVDKYTGHDFFHIDKYGINFMKTDELMNADIIHIHWINEGVWSHNFAIQLKKLNKPIVWTMHDMWAFTGGCHYTGNCTKYYDRCGSCPALKSNNKKDISYKESKWKKSWVKGVNIRFVGCSKWIADEFNKSKIGKFSKKKALCIPNPVETDKFYGMDKKVCRQILKTYTDKKIILFGAMSAVRDKRKGFEYLVRAMKKLSPRQYTLGIFGSNVEDYDIIKEKLNDFDVINFGIVKDDLHLAMIYNIADVFTAPSLQENLANTVMESLSCGTPVVAFNIGGMPDMIKHQQNGYLARVFDESDLAAGIESICESRLNSQEISDDTKNRFSVDKLAEKYIKVYKNLCRNGD